MVTKILVPLDGSALAECVLPHVFTWARLTGAPVTLLRVLEQNAAPSHVHSVNPMDWRLREIEAEAYLQDIARRLTKAGLTAPIKIVLLSGQAPERIIEYAHEHRVDLIILSSHGRSGLSRCNISSVLQKITFQAHISVLIIRAYQAEQPEVQAFPYRRVLVPLDGSQRAEMILPLLNRLSQEEQAELLLVHVITRPEMPHWLPLTHEEKALVDKLVERNRKVIHNYFEQLKSRLSKEVRTLVLVRDNTINTLHTLIEDQKIDLVLLSAHGYSGQKKQPYGSVGTSFILYGSSSLLIVQDLDWKEIEPSPAAVASRQGDGERRNVNYDKPSL